MKTDKIVKGFFNDDYGKPFIITEGQKKIFDSVFDPLKTRIAITAYTQYGKSEVVSMAVDLMMLTRYEKVLIIAPSGEQSAIIMGNCIKHFFDNDLFSSALDIGDSKEKLKREKSKKRIRLSNNSEVFILTANVREINKEANNIMGFGASVIIIDESSLIPDKMFAKILRMVGGQKRGKIVQLGNAFGTDNHFKRAFSSKRYETIKIDWRQGVKEKRISESFINECREEMDEVDFQILYECNFPKIDAENSLIKEEWIQRAINNNIPDGEKYAGLDVARYGNDSSVYILRAGGNVKKIKVIKKMDTMEVVGWAAHELDIDDPENINVDVIGLGAGVYDRLSEEGYNVTEINVGAGASDDDKKKLFANLRAELYWDLRNRFKKGNISIPNDKELIKELLSITYSYNSSKKIKIVGKDEIKKDLGRSPDKADALMLAFSSNSSLQMFI